MHSHAVELAQYYLTALLIIFLIGTLGGKIAEKLRLPDVAIYMIIGILIGPQVFSMIDIPANSTVNQMILIFGATFIIFHGGTITSLRVLKKVWRTITLLSTTGVLLTAVVVAIAASYIFHINFMVALLLGAILASTDPAALVPIFHKFPVRKTVSQTVITESAFTDATGAIMTTVVFGILTSESNVNGFMVILEFLQLAIGGIVIGAVIGLIATLLVSEHKRGVLRDFTPMVIILTILTTYLVAEWAHASGFMAAFVAGLMFGNARTFKLTILQREEHAAHTFIDAIGLKLRMLIFILLGSQVDFAVLKEYGLLALLVVAIFMFVARPITVLTSLLPDKMAKWSKKEILFFFWTRETGVIPAALVGIVASSSLAEGKLLSAVTFVAILVTILLQASTTPLLARKLNLMETVSISKEKE